MVAKRSIPQNVYRVWPAGPRWRLQVPGGHFLLTTQKLLATADSPVGGESQCGESELLVQIPVIRCTACRAAVRCFSLVVETLAVLTDRTISVHAVACRGAPPLPPN